MVEFEDEKAVESDEPCFIAGNSGVSGGKTCFEDSVLEFALCISAGAGGEFVESCVEFAEKAHMKVTVGPGGWSEGMVRAGVIVTPVGKEEVLNLACWAALEVDFVLG